MRKAPKSTKQKRYVFPPLFEVVEDDSYYEFPPAPSPRLRILDSDAGRKAIASNQLQEPRPEYLAKPESFERIETALESLWADSHFWEHLEQYKKASSDLEKATLSCVIDDYIAKHYVRISGIPSHDYWISMKTDPGLKKAFFGTICQRHQGLHGLPPPLEYKTAAILLRILELYLLTPTRADYRAWIAAQGLQPEGLDLLGQIANALSEDVAWCRANPGELPVPNPRQRRGKPHSREKAKTIESMVAHLKDQPSLTNEQLAEKVGARTRTRVRYASLARKLALHRENIPLNLLYPPNDARRAPNQKRLLES